MDAAVSVTTVRKKHRRIGAGTVERNSAPPTQTGKW